jgi:outer membrane lipoprotein-sorting protein
MALAANIARRIACLVVFSVASQIAAASEKPTPAKQANVSFAATGQGDSLDKVLHAMDQASANFRSAQANFVWTTFNAVANDTVGTDKGKIYFRRANKETEMAADVTDPAPKQIRFTGGKIQVYQPAIAQVDAYDAGAHREEFETFLVLGFGSSGTETRKSFEIKYVAAEKIGNIETAKIELTPMSAKVKQQFPKIDLWIDLNTGVSLRQQLWQAGGDYRLADYSDIQLNKKITDSVFKLKTSGSTKFVNH